MTRHFTTVDELGDKVLDGEQSRAWRPVFHCRSAILGVLRGIKGEL